MTPEEFLSLNHGLRLGMNRSPLREGDRNPSLSIFIRNGTVGFKDHATNQKGRVEKLLELINVSYDKIEKTVEYVKEEKTFTFEVRSLKRHDKAFWGNFNINCELLDKYKIQAIRELKLNDKRIYFDDDRNPCYCFELPNPITGKTEYKFYRPYATKMKFLSSALSYNLMGLKQFKEVALQQRDSFWDTVIVTKSMKDVLTLRTMNILSVAVHSESASWKMVGPIISDLMRSFRRDKLLFLYDNDGPGIAGAKQIAADSGGKWNALPQENQCKDPSDLVKKAGQKAEQIIRETIAGGINWGSGPCNPDFVRLLNVD